MIREVKAKPILLDDINKITNNLAWLSTNCVFRANVNLFNSSQKYGRRSYHSETSYWNEKAEKRVVNLNLDYDPYLTIEQVRPTEAGFKEFIRFRLQDVYAFRRIVNNMLDVLNGDGYKKVYGLSHGKLILRTHDTRAYSITTRPRGKYLLFSYDIMEMKNGELVPCIRMNLASETNYVLISVGKMMELSEVLYHLNVCTFGQLLVNYIGKPELGTNLYVVKDGLHDSEEDVVVNKPGRVVSINSNQRKKSFFDSHDIK